MKQCKNVFCKNIVEDTIYGWGKEIHPVYCKQCRKNHKEWKERDERMFSHHLASQHCEHGAENLNPGGYCNICGRGYDFS
jgi:hypothetical protein